MRDNECHHKCWHPFLETILWNSCHLYIMKNDWTATSVRSGWSERPCTLMCIIFFSHSTYCTRPSPEIHCGQAMDNTHLDCSYPCIMCVTCLSGIPKNLGVAWGWRYNVIEVSPFTPGTDPFSCFHISAHTYNVLCYSQFHWQSIGYKTTTILLNMKGIIIVNYSAW